MNSAVYFDIETIAKGAIYPDEISSNPFSEISDINREMQLIAERYSIENRLQDFIAKGDEAAAMDTLREYSRLMRSPMQRICFNSKDRLRDFKNAIIMMNTLFRKTAENRHVPPFYIHYASSRINYEIDSAGSFEEVAYLIPGMISEYCSLVRQHSLSECSELIREALLYIQTNLCASISTADIAAHLNITPNYLSGRFRAEIGCSVTEYIRRERMETAAYFLRTTDLSVGEIANRVGIDAQSYFTRQFRTEKGCSPMQYRKEHRANRT